MDKRVSSRAIIIEDNKLLAMFRRKVKDGKTKEYYDIPGGVRENNETLEENVIRELKEEFEIDIRILGYLGVEEHESTIEHYFHCERVSGTPKISGEELERMTESNYYEPRYIDLTNLDNIDINAKDKIAQALNQDYKELD